MRQFLIELGVGFAFVGSQVPLDNGQTVVADDAYLKESFTDPDAKIVKGFQKGVMAATVKPIEAQIQQGDNLDALVLVPTRELAAQVGEVLEPLAAARGLRVATAYGGVGRR